VRPSWLRWLSASGRLRSSHSVWQIHRKYSGTLTRSNMSFNEAQGKLEREWLTGVTRFDYDGPGKRLVVASPRRRVVFDARVIGTLRHQDKSWEWAWNNPHVEPAVRVPGEALQEIGRRFDLRHLTRGMIPVPRDDFPFFLGGIALRVMGGVGVYRAWGKDVGLYLLLANPRIERAGAGRRQVPTRRGAARSRR
jgi:Family of unknown function (DUF6882)